jgi:hypothetical protein
MSVDHGAPARAVRVALKGDLTGTVRAVALAEYKDSLVDHYYNTREFQGGSASAADGAGWRVVELSLPQPPDFGSDHVEYTNAAGQRTSMDIAGRLAAVELFFSGVGNEVPLSADRSLLIDWVCFLPPAN